MGVKDGYYGTSRPSAGQYDVGASEFSGKPTSSDSPNKNPTVDAGSDNSLRLPINSITLTASGADTDGKVVSYQWTKESGPSATLKEASGQKTIGKGHDQRYLRLLSNGER